MNPQTVRLVVEKLIAAEPLSEDEELVWIALRELHWCAGFKKKAIQASQIADSGRWPRGWSQETKLAIALALDRHDVLSDMGLTFFAAVDRIPMGWHSHVELVQGELRAAGLSWRRKDNAMPPQGG